MRTGKLIRREEAACWQTGQQYLQRAQQEAQAILASAHEQALSDAARIVATELEQARAEQAELMTEVAVRRDAYLAEIEPELVEVVVNAVRKIFSEFDDNERARIVVEKALRTLRNQKQVTVRVHPSQYETMRASVGVLMNACANLKILTVESDSRILPGACSLSSDIGIVEIDLETQICAIEYAIRRKTSAVELHSDAKSALQRMRVSVP